jgi:hypothetical protein
MTKEEVEQLVREHDKGMSSVLSISAFLQTLVDSNHVMNFVVNNDTDHLVVTIQMSRALDFHTFELIEYYREKRLNKLLNKNKDED